MMSYLIAAAAGLVAAVLFLPYVSGSPLGLFLFILSPLPIVMIALGWGLSFSIISSATAVFLLSFINSILGISFFLFFCLPVLILSHYFYLSRPVSTPVPATPPAQSAPDLSDETQNNATNLTNASNQLNTVEWYPLGRLIVWLSAIVGVLCIILLLQIGSDYQTYFQRIQEYWDQFYAGVFKQIAPAELTESDVNTIILQIALSLPGAMAFLLFFLVGFNFWLGAKIIHMSERLKRPWPDFSTIDYPNIYVVAFAATLLGTILLPLSFAKLISLAFFGAVSSAYFVLGLVVIHVILRGSQFRLFALFTLYFLLLILQWLALLVVIIGVGEPLFNLRKRALAQQPRNGG